MKTERRYARDLKTGDRIAFQGKRGTVGEIRRTRAYVQMNVTEACGRVWRVTCDEGDRFSVSVPVRTNDAGGGMSRAEGKRQRKAIGKQIEADLRAKAQAETYTRKRKYTAAELADVPF